MAFQYLSSIADVQAEFKSLTFSASTTPTDTQVNDMIDEEEQVVDASVGMKYSTPVTSATSPKAYKILRKTVKELVCGRVKNIIAVKSGATDANQGKVSDGDAMIKRALDRLKDIRDGNITLTDASLLSSNDGVRSYNVDNEVASDDDDPDDANDPFAQNALNTGNSVPTFQRGKRNW